MVIATYSVSWSVISVLRQYNIIISLLWSSPAVCSTSILPSSGLRFNRFRVTVRPRGPRVSIKCLFARNVGKSSSVEKASTSAPGETCRRSFPKITCRVACKIVKVRYTSVVYIIHRHIAGVTTILHTKLTKNHNSLLNVCAMNIVQVWKLIQVKPW